MFNIMTLKLLAMTQIILVRSENDKIYQVKTVATKFGVNGTIEKDGNTTLLRNDEDNSSFLRYLFKKYGREEVMTFEGLEHLLNNLGLGHVTSFGHGLQSHIDEMGNFVEFHGEHKHTVKSQNHGEAGQSNGNASKLDETQEMSFSRSYDANTSCMSAKEILRTFHIQYNGGIQTSEFLLLCPALVYQLDQQLCRSRTLIKQVPDEGEIISSFYLSPWVGAFVAVGIISLVGFFVVGIIPWIANCSFYTILIQILISLAVGTLTADALLHLLPHAMVPHHLGHSHSLLEGDHDSHSKHPVWVGVVTFGAILMFFVVERSLKISSDTNVCRNSKKIQRKVPSKFTEKELTDTNVNPLEMVYLKNGNGMEFHKDGCISSIEKLKELTVYQSACKHDLDDNSLQHRLESVTRNDGEDNGEQSGQDHHHYYHGSHGHSHKVPSSIGSVAWMVIMGDGLHNFTDGLAIGASFSSNIATGVSTSIAVLCHELPHELGDFAMLLKSGMSLKQAFICNLLSSVLCFLGASLGITIGNIDSITSWVFSITAGIFIYIALVDMLPQVTSVYDRVSPPESVDYASREEAIRGHQCTQKKSDKCRGCLLPKLNFSEMGTLSYLLLHTFGMLAGLSLMLIIAIYEDRIKVEIN